MASSVRRERKNLKRQREDVRKFGLAPDLDSRRNLLRDIDIFDSFFSKASLDLNLADGKLRELFETWINEALPPERPVFAWLPPPDDLIKLGPKSIQIVMADPPWPYESNDGGANCSRTFPFNEELFLVAKGNFGTPFFYAGRRMGFVDKHYETMDIEDLCCMCQDWLEPFLADDCVLLMWATGPKAHGALAVMNSWKFDYKNKLFYWLKTYGDGKPSLGLGSYTRTCMEELLIGTRGDALKKYVNKDVAKYTSQAFIADKERPCLETSQSNAIEKMKHSEKPAKFRRLLDDFFGNATNKLELFARERYEGWIPYGNQLSKQVQMKLHF